MTCPCMQLGYRFTDATNSRDRGKNHKALIKQEVVTNDDLAHKHGGWDKVTVVRVIGKNHMVPNTDMVPNADMVPATQPENQ